MSDTPSRQDTVEENIENIESQYGPEAWPQIQTQILKDISISLAILCDKSGT